MTNRNNISLPKNWIQYKFESVFEVVSTNGLKVKQKEYLNHGKLAVIDQGQDLIGGYTDEIVNKVMVSLPVIVFGDHTKALKFINFNFAPGADGIKILKPKQSIEPKFAFYLLHIIRNQIPDKGYARHFQYLRQEKYFVPPLPEQQRIVAKIEELFSEIDKAVENMQTARQQLKTYRQSVLKHAFEGKLTAAWRESSKFRVQSSKFKNESLKLAAEPESVYQTKNGLPEGWKWKTVGDICTKVEYGSSKKSDKEGLVPVLRMGNIQNGLFDWTDLVFSSDSEEIEKYRLKKGDVLFNRTNSPELVGKTAIYLGEQEAIFAGYLIRIHYKNDISPKYLTYYLNSLKAKEFGNSVKTDGVNQSNINGQKLKSYPFPKCTLEEQNQIVAEIEKRFSEADKLEESIETALRQTEALRQSILKKAFAGKLVEQDEN